MGVTIKQIAEMAGVHRSTVDKVLHNREGVSEPVRKRVQKIIDECSYQPNPIGRALQMQDKILQIGIILLNVDALPYLKAGIQEALKQYATFNIQVEYRDLEYTDIGGQVKAIQSFAAEKKDAIILSPVNVAEIAAAIDTCTQAGVPVFTVNSDIKGTTRQCFIGQNGFKAGRIAGRLLGEFLQGKGQVAVFTSDNGANQTFPFGTREGGFLEVLSETFPDVEILRSISTQEDTKIILREMKSLCESYPDIKGIFITCGGVKEVGEVLKVYELPDVKLICFESYPEIMELLKNGIVTATLDSKLEWQGEKVVEVLMDYLIYNRCPLKRHIYSETHILVKESL